MRRDLRAIRHDMHATSIEVTGDGVDRLNATASEAAELGLHIWLQPTLGDRPRRRSSTTSRRPAGTWSGCAARARGPT